MFHSRFIIRKIFVPNKVLIGIDYSLALSYVC